MRYGSNVQRLGLVDERDCSRTKLKNLHVFGRTVDGGGYSFAPQVEIDRSANMKFLEEMEVASSDPSCADGRVGLKIMSVPCIVYDVVEDLLRESW